MPDFPIAVKCRLGGTTWLIRPEAADDLLPSLERGVEELAAQGQMLKDKPNRRIFRVVLPRTARTVVIKQYRNRTAAETLKRSFLSSTAMREWRRANAMVARGVPVPFPLAVGHERRGALLTNSWLITQALPEARTLREEIETQLPGPSRKALLQRVAKVVRRMHDADFQHGDLHASNILVSTHESGLGVYIADVHEVRLRRMGFRCRCLDLAGLNASLPRHTASATERLRFLKDYLLARRMGGAEPMPGGRRILDWGVRMAELKGTPQLKSWAREVLRYTRRMLAHYYRSRTRRCLVNSTLFAVRKAERGKPRLSAGKLYCDRRYTTEEIWAIVSRHGQCLSGGEGTVLKRTAHTNVTLVDDPRGGRRVCVKEYCPRGLLNRLKDLFRPPPAKREWVAARGLACRNIGAPAAIALLCPPLRATRQSYYFVTGELSGGLPIHAHAARLAATSSRDARIVFVRQAADFLASLHLAEVVHGDLKASNLLVTDASEGGHERSGRRFLLVDLAAMRFRPARVREIVRNLAQLNASVPLVVTSADRLRFLRRYLRRMGLQSRERLFARAVLRESAARSEVWRRM